VVAYAQSEDVVSVLEGGAAGDGIADDSVAIQQTINNSPENSAIEFGDGRTFLISRTILLKPNRRYMGTSTLRMSAGTARLGPMFLLRYGHSDNVTVEGLTFDATGGDGILRVGVEGGTDSPVKNLVVKNCTFANTKWAGHPGESAIYAPAGLRDAAITGNQFRNCSACVWITNPSSVSITNNDFDTVYGNAISVVAYNYPFASGDGLDISYNTGRNLDRMAIEVFGSGPGTRMEAPTITNNAFVDWRKSGTKDPYGISVVVGRAAHISNNILSGGVADYGIEVGIPEAIVEGNTVEGFPYGIVIQGQRQVTVRNNTLKGQTEAAIFLSNAGPNQNAKILDNTIIDPRKFGIGADPNDYGGSTIAGNRITRAAGVFTEDGRTYPFIGIKIDAGLSSPVVVKDNSIRQTAAKLPLNFSFWGVAVFGACSGCTFDSNTIESSSDAPAGIGIVLWYGPFIDSATIIGNRFVNLASLTNGFTSGRTVAAGNTVYRVTNPDPNLVGRPPQRTGVKR